MFGVFLGLILSMAYRHKYSNLLDGDGCPAHVHRGEGGAEVKQLGELKLTAHDKAWIKIHARKYMRPVAWIRKRLRDRFGEDVDPRSLREFIDGEKWLPVAAQSRRSMPDRQLKQSQNIGEQLDADARRAERAGDFDPRSLD